MAADRKPNLPAARRLAEDIRALYQKDLEDAERWRQIATAMKTLLLEPSLRQRAQTWPMTIGGAGIASNLLLYEDPDYGFVFNVTVRKENTVSNVHDHGSVWTLYGLVEGRETMVRYKRPASDLGPAQLILIGRREIGPGDIDVVPPGEIHQEHAGPERSIAFIVRGRRPGTFQQHQYDLATGNVSVNNGPRQVEEPL